MRSACIFARGKRSGDARRTRRRSRFVDQRRTELVELWGTLIRSIADRNWQELQRQRRVPLAPPTSLSLSSSARQVRRTPKWSNEALIAPRVYSRVIEVDDTRGTYSPGLVSDHAAKRWPRRRRTTPRHIASRRAASQDQLAAPPTTALVSDHNPRARLAGANHASSSFPLRRHRRLLLPFPRIAARFMPYYQYSNRRVVSRWSDATRRYGVIDIIRADCYWHEQIINEVMIETYIGTILIHINWLSFFTYYEKNVEDLILLIQNCIPSIIRKCCVYLSKTHSSYVIRSCACIHPLH